MSGRWGDLGIKIIGEMSKEELIDELVAAQRKSWEGREMTDLKREVIHLRMTIIQESMIKEAGLKAEHGMLGMQIVEDDD